MFLRCHVLSRLQYPAVVFHLGDTDAHINYYNNFAVCTHTFLGVKLFPLHANLTWCHSCDTEIWKP